MRERAAAKRFVWRAIRRKEDEEGALPGNQNPLEETLRHAGEHTHPKKIESREGEARSLPTLWVQHGTFRQVLASISLIYYSY